MDGRAKKARVRDAPRALIYTTEPYDESYHRTAEIMNLVSRVTWFRALESWTILASQILIRLLVVSEDFLFGVKL